METFGYLSYLKSTADSLSVGYLASEILNCPRFANATGSHNDRGHHYGEGGLLQHTYEVVATAMTIAGLYGKTYPVDRTVIFLAALYHDYGKLWDYSYDDNVCTVNPHRRKIHHISRSSIEWNRIATNYNLPEKTKDEVTHCILAHHGARECGSPITPYTREAYIVHYSDSLSARINDCQKLDMSTLK